MPAMFTSEVASGIPQIADAVERRVEHGVEREVAERDERRDPVRLQAEERAVQHQHRAVEGEPEAERRERSRDDGVCAGVNSPRW